MGSSGLLLLRVWVSYIVDVSMPLVGTGGCRGLDTETKLTVLFGVVPDCGL